jgi:Asp-tRNA(Asn)/Glu-tRNA(Gln) amidotransferase A subunit family amidase
MDQIDLCYLPAVEALALFRARELSPVELLEALIARAEAVEPKVNAFSYTYYDEALEAARRAEWRYIRGDPRPLEGIPIAIKDESFIAGKVTSNGSLLLQDFVADSTSLVVQRLLDAGAIVHARTTTPEFSIAAVTWSRLWGVTRNPWNLACTCGGSSGGSGAALAAGTTTLANGSDIGGSIRIPASFCGVVGYKAPYGRNPEDPPFNLEYYDHPGPMTRTVADCALMQNVISGPHPLDIASLKPKLTLPERFDSIENWRIAYSLDLGYKTVSPEVRDRTLAALEVFRGLGATVEEVELGWTEAASKAALDHLAYCVMGYWILQYYDTAKEQMTSYARDFAEQVRRVTAKEGFEAEMVAAEMYAKLSAVFDDYDLFVCPTLAATFVPADFDSTAEDAAIEGMPAGDIGINWLLTYPFNMLSRCPVLAVPSGRAANNVPTGLQLVGPTYEDVRVFQAATAYEAAAGTFFSQANRPDL